MKWLLFLCLVLGGMSAAAQPVDSDSIQVEPSIGLGDEAPHLGRGFSIAGGGTQLPSESFGTAATVVIFWVDACPWTIVSRDRLQEIVARYSEEGVGFLFVELRRPGDTGAPSSGPEIEGAPLLLDPTGELTSAYGAAVAPEVFVFNSERRLVYAGAIDDSPADDETVRAEFLVEMVDALLSGEEFEPRRESALGCIGSQDRQLENG